jgi:hypothetical protein
VSRLNLNDPTAVLLAVVEALRAAGIDSAAYGGLALAAYGEPRETKDADVAIAGVGGADAAAALERAGLTVHLAFDRVPFGGNVVTRLTLLSGDHPSDVNTADLVEPRSARYANLALERSLAGTLRERALRVLSPEDFIIFKVLSTRERDIEDAVTVVRSLRDRLDLPAMKAEVVTLGLEISDHDVTGRFGRILALSA